MAERKQFRAIKGVRDILPPETALWNWFEHTAREVLESYNFREIRLPIFEETELFARSVGVDTDIVSKEMFSFVNPDSRDLHALRGRIASRVIQQGNAIGVELFREGTQEFLERLEAGLRDGVIPRHAENMVNMKRVREGFEKLEKLQLGGTFLQEPAGWNEVAGLIDHIEHFSAVLDLGEDLTLRPEATAPVVRAYIEHGMRTWPGNVKLYYVGPMFRRERPQKGRYRQFYQIGAEVLGQSDHPAIDAELIEMLTVLLRECRIGRWTLLVNSIGCSNCRPKYVEILRQALEGVKSRMCADCQRRMETNPLRVLDCKVEADQPIIEKLPAIVDHLDDPCREHFQEFQRQLGLREIPYTIQPRLVRGLDYYMRTTFEITSPVLGAQNALVGGGRYDGLSELLGGPPVKGIGFALGEDRFIEAMKAEGKVDAAHPVDVYVAWIGAAAYPVAVRLARRLRDASFTVELPPEEMKLKRSLGLADKLGARYALLVGEDEIASGAYVLRRMSDGEQKKLAESELVEYLKTSQQKEKQKA